MIDLPLDEIQRKILSNKLESLVMKEDKLKSRNKVTGDKHLFFQEITLILGINFDSRTKGGNHISGGSTIQRGGLKHIYDELTKNLEESPSNKSKFGYLQSILKLLGETYEKNLDTSSGSTITCWSLFKILRSLE